MKNIAKFLLLVLALPLCIISCQDDDEGEQTGYPSIPSGTYFRMQDNGVNYWSGSNLKVMTATKEMNGTSPKFYDFTVNSNLESDSIYKNRLFLHATVNDDGSLGNYVIYYSKNENKLTNSFDEYCTYTSGALTISDTSNGTITATFSGTITNILNSQVKNVNFYFQKFPLKAVTGKKK